MRMIDLFLSPNTLTNINLQTLKKRKNLSDRSQMKDSSSRMSGVVVSTEGALSMAIKRQVNRELVDWVLGWHGTTGDH